MSVLSSDRAAIERDFATNFFGTLDTTRQLVPVIERNGGGAIANVLTVVSLASMAALGGYSAAKAAAFSMTQSLRIELRPRKIAGPRGLPRSRRYRHVQGHHVALERQFASM
jgi:NAD(P)-dependent dehydrogenase (short-subunit alcohol dehydrogenase family)